MEPRFTAVGSTVSSLARVHLLHECMLQPYRDTSMELVAATGVPAVADASWPWALEFVW